MGTKSRVLVLVAVVGIVALVVACGGGGSVAPITTVKTADGKVSFKDTVQPILQDHCKRCHDVGSERSVLMMMTHEGVMKGGKNGAVVVPGDPDASQIGGSIEKKKIPNMPPKIFPALPPDRIDAIRAWIAEGAENN